MTASIVLSVKTAPGYDGGGRWSHHCAFHMQAGGLPNTMTILWLSGAHSPQDNLMTAWLVLLIKTAPHFDEGGR
jgi:hypothetical protein